VLHIELGNLTVARVSGDNLQNCVDDMWAYDFGSLLCVRFHTAEAHELVFLHRCQPMGAGFPERRRADASLRSLVHHLGREHPSVGWCQPPCAIQRDAWVCGFLFFIPLLLAVIPSFILFLMSFVLF
jgi:hypothetical protein